MKLPTTGNRKVTVTLILAMSFLVSGFLLAIIGLVMDRELSGVAAIITAIAAGLTGLAGFFSWGNRAEHKDGG